MSRRIYTEVSLSKGLPVPSPCDCLHGYGGACLPQVADELCVERQAVQQSERRRRKRRQTICYPGYMHAVIQTVPTMLFFFFFTMTVFHFQFLVPMCSSSETSKNCSLIWQWHFNVSMSAHYYCTRLCPACAGLSLHQGVASLTAYSALGQHPSSEARQVEPFRDNPFSDEILNKNGDLAIHTVPFPWTAVLSLKDWFHAKQKKILLIFWPQVSIVP